MDINVLCKNGYEALNLQNFTPEPSIEYTNEAYLFNNFLLVPSQLKNNMNFYGYMAELLKLTPDKFISQINSYDTIEISTPTLFASTYWTNNYSHSTLQALGTLLLAEKYNILDNNLTIIFPKGRRFHIGLLEIFNHKNLNFLEIKPNILYKFYSFFYSNLYFQDTPTSSNRPFGKSLIDLFTKKTKEIVPSPYKKIYITRINAPRRIPSNEKEVITHLSKKNFKIVNFDKISVINQIQLIKGAKIIIASHGASGVNLVYKGLDKFKFIEIFCGRFVPWHTLILQSKNCLYSPLKFEPEIPKWIDSPFEIDLKLLDFAIKNHSYHFSRSNESKVDCKNLYKSLTYIANLYYTHDYIFPKCRKFSLLTWHKTWISLSQNKLSLIHSQNIFTELKIIIKNNLIFFLIPSIQKYICSISENGNIELSSFPVSFFIEYNMTSNNISIMVNGKYLCAKTNGTFILQPKKDIWEHFYIKPF